MARNGRLTTDQWGLFMPAHNPVVMKGPWYYRDTQSVVFEYLTDADQALRVLPAELELHEPATAFLIVETNRWTSFGPYSEVYNGILCKWQGELYAYKKEISTQIWRSRKQVRRQRRAPGEKRHFEIRQRRERWHGEEP